MEHVVFFPGPDGLPAFRRFATLDEAVRYVEHVRNNEGVSEVSVHALVAVPVSFRAYYRVEVPGADEVTEAADVTPLRMPEQAPTLEAVPDVTADDAADPEPLLVEAGPDEAPAAGKRSLGFFAH